MLPGPEHLMSLRRLIYPEVVRGPEPAAQTEGPLRCTEILSLTYEMTLDGAEAETLIRMTPTTGKPPGLTRPFWQSCRPCL